MVEIEVNETIARAQQEALAVLFVSNNDTRKRIRKIIREELKDAVRRLREDARYEMYSDPRKAYKAVKSMIYRKILGGNVSILQRKKAGAPRPLMKERKLDRNPRQRGGNRVPRSKRTIQLDEYYGADRSFVLRFLNSGTKVRYAGYGRNGRSSLDYDNFILKHNGMGNRGSITARNWFANLAPREMDLAAENLSNVIEEELAEAFKEKSKD